MTKQCLYWKPVICTNVRGAEILSNRPEILSKIHRGNLLADIQSMPPKEPISFERAMRLMCEKTIEAFQNHDGAKAAWYYYNFIPYISSCGFHIELTGDEFIFHLSTASL